MVTLSEPHRRSVPSPWPHRAEAACVALFFALCRLLPIDTASWIGGRLGRRIGPLLGVSRQARRNLAAAFPDWPLNLALADLNRFPATGSPYTDTANWNSLSAGDKEIVNRVLVNSGKAIGTPLDRWPHMLGPQANPDEARRDAPQERPAAHQAQRQRNGE